MSTQNVNIARFARNVKWDFSLIFKHRGRYHQVLFCCPICLNKKFNLSCRNRDKLTDEWPKAKEVLVHQKAHEASNKKFDLQEVEIWVTLASVMGALLALLGFQICRLCKTKTRNRMDSSRQMVMFNFDSLHDSFVH